MDSKERSKYGGLDREDPHTTARIVEKLFPDEDRRLALLVFKDYVLKAYHAAEAKWGTTLYPNDICLNVGGYYVCWTEAGRFHLAYLQQALALEYLQEIQELTNQGLVRRTSDYKRIPGSESISVLPKHIERVLPLVERAVEAFIFRAIERCISLSRREQEAHSPGIIRFLESYFGENLPQPAYFWKSSLEKDKEQSYQAPLLPQTVPEAVKPLLLMARRTRNILLYGPPGTGKTWLVTQFAKAFTDPDKAEMVTFHQSFAYEEFVEGVKPVIHEGQVSYAVVDGVFKRACRTAEKNPDSEYLLIIDEINRANIAKVLGELITLIEDDKRLGQANAVQVTLPYSGERFGVPDNLTILGTMNTADRSIALLDLALRRRFTFVEMPPDPTLLPEDVAGVNVRALLTRLNKRIAALLDRDHQIGHSYLMGANNGDGLHFAWYRRVVPLLQEYFYGDDERLGAVLGSDFVRAVTLDTETMAALGGAYEETARVEIAWLDGEVFLTALRRLAGASPITEESAFSE